MLHRDSGTNPWIYFYWSSRDNEQAYVLPDTYKFTCESATRMFILETNIQDKGRRNNEQREQKNGEMYIRRKKRWWRKNEGETEANKEQRSAITGTFVILRNLREGIVTRKWWCLYVPWSTYPTGAVLCLWPPAAHPPWGSFLFACSAVELPSPLRSVRSPSCVLPPSRTWRRLFRYKCPRNTLLPHPISEPDRSFRPPLSQSRQATADCSRFLPPHWGALQGTRRQHTGQIRPTSLSLLQRKRNFLLIYLLLFISRVRWGNRWSELILSKLFISEIVAGRHGSYTSSHRLDENEAPLLSDLGSGRTGCARAVPLFTPVHNKASDHWSRKKLTLFFLHMGFSNNR